MSLFSVYYLYRASRVLRQESCQAQPKQKSEGKNHNPSLVPVLSGSEQAARGEAVVTNQDLLPHTERHHVSQRLAS